MRVMSGKVLSLLCLEVSQGDLDGDTNFIYFLLRVHVAGLGMKNAPLGCLSARASPILLNPKAVILLGNILNKGENTLKDS